MKKIFLFVLALVIALSLASCKDNKETSNGSEQNQTSNTASTDTSSDTSDETSKKSVLEMTDAELKELYADISTLDLETKTGEANFVIKIEMKQTGLTKSYELTQTEKNSIRDDGTIKRACQNKIVGYMLEVNTEYIFDDGMAYIYADFGNFKAPCNIDDFQPLLSGVELSSQDLTMKAIEETDEYVVIQYIAEANEENTEDAKDIMSDILSLFMGIDEYENYILISETQTAKIVGNFVERVDAELEMKFTVGDEDVEVKMEINSEYSTKDPIIIVPQTDVEYFELPRINAIDDLKSAIKDFLNSGFVSFVNKSDLDLNSKSNKYVSKSINHVSRIFPDGTLKFKIISEYEVQGEKLEIVTNYNGTKYETVTDGEKETVTMSQDSATGVLLNYCPTFIFNDLYTGIKLAKEEDGILYFEYEIGDKMFEIVAGTLVYSMFDDTEGIELKDVTNKTSHFTIKDSTLINAGYDLDFTFMYGSELHTFKVSIEISDIRQLDENTTTFDI